MKEVIVFLLLGMGSGALISATGIGVVLSYRGSGLINLATGTFSMLSGYCFWALRDGRYGRVLATAPAIGITILFSLVLAALFELLVITPLRSASPLARVVASLGFLLSTTAAVVLEFGAGGHDQPSLLTTRVVGLFGYQLLVNRFVIAGLITAAALLLAALFRWTRFGLATRAAAENETYAVLAGLSPRALSLANTLLMSLVMTLVGLLASSIQVLDPTDLPLLVIPGVAAALFGGLRSIGVTLVAGIVMGAFEALLLYASTLRGFPSDGAGNPLPGAQELLTFLFLVAAMHFRGGRLPRRGELRERRLPSVPLPRRPWWNAVMYGALASVCLLIFPPEYRDALVISFVWAVMLLSITLVTGFIGQVSVVQLALGGVAAYATGLVTEHWGIGFPLAPLLGVAAACLVGLAVGLPALRVRGVSLVVVTLAAAVAIENFVFGNNAVFAAAAFITVPKFFGIEIAPNELVVFDGSFPSLAFCFLVLALLLGVGLLICNIRRSRLGQEMLAVRANERAAAAIGINVAHVKLLGFVVGAAIAGLGGVFLAYSLGVVTSGSSDPMTAIALIAFAYIGGITTVPGAAIGGLLFTGDLLAFCLEQWFGVTPEWTTLIAGLLLIAVLVWAPDGIAGALLYRTRALPIQLSSRFGGSRAAANRSSRLHPGFDES